MYKNSTFNLFSKYIIRLLFFVSVFGMLSGNLYAISSESNNIFHKNGGVCGAVDVPLWLDDTIVKDSITVHAPSNTIEHPVDYQSKDSCFVDLKNKRAYLYGEAQVTYGDITLTAEYIMIDFADNTVFACGETDSAGSVFGKPVFVEGEETFKADTIRYNFNSKKAIIKEVTTEFEGSFLHGGVTKKQADNEVHLIHGKFTTCNLDHPHYYFNISKAIMIPDDKIVSGPAYLVIEDVPLPLGIPFGFFPNKKGSTSGIVFPEFGEEQNRGFFLRRGGYYFAINDRVDLLLTGDIYSKGSFGLYARTNYKKRYKMNGSVDLSFNNNRFGYRGLDNFRIDRLYSIKWKHNQDAKARPNSTFSADVNISSSAYDKWNSYNDASYMNTTKQSRISYSKVWPNTPFSLSMALAHTQNSTDSTVNLTLPDVTFNMSKIYPLKRKSAVGKQRWYEKIGISYSAVLTNQATVREDSLLNITLDNLNNGIQHSIPVNTSLKVLKFINITPAFQYTERWYSRSVEKLWQPDSVGSLTGDLVKNYTYGFNRAWDYKASCTMNTTVYGMFQFKKGPVKAFRHVLTPSVSFIYYPDFGQPRYGYYDDYYRIQYNNNTGQYDTVSYVYSVFEGLPYGTPTRGGAGSLSFNLGNTLDMKVRNRADTVSGEKKIKLLEGLSFNTNYNIMADSLKWAPITMSGRTSLGKVSINFSSVFDPYAITRNEYGTPVRYNASEFSSSGKILRITSANLSVGFNFNAQSKTSKNQTAASQLYGYPDDYVDFDVPWNLRLSYNLRYSKPYFDQTVTQSLQVSGDVNVTSKWKVSVSSGWDFVNDKITYTTINIYRDLHCWEASLQLIPFGLHKSYSFKINVKAAMLQDLKLSKRRSWYDNF
ncbi:MAG: LPS-assembly protein LptD [Bacteroidales bacterium]|nr:LPS-assembly protein LptD [Bacteroidales bacterium]HQP04875.1 putative LPS assembly protein LptD [Bacteroidales bacterium]